jgi:hypothetical protein
MGGRDSILIGGVEKITFIQVVHCKVQAYAVKCSAMDSIVLHGDKNNKKTVPPASREDFYHQ